MTLANTQLTFIASIKEKIRLAQYEALIYNAYHEVEFLQPLVAEISQTKHIAIMSKYKNGKITGENTWLKK